MKMEGTYIVNGFPEQYGSQGSERNWWSAGAKRRGRCPAGVLQRSDTSVPSLLRCTGPLWWPCQVHNDCLAAEVHVSAVWNGSGCALCSLAPSLTRATVMWWVRPVRPAPKAVIASQTRNMGTCRKETSVRLQKFGLREGGDTLLLYLIQFATEKSKKKGLQRERAGNTSLILLYCAVNNRSH